MLPPVVCFTCGLPLGDLAPIYRLILEKRMGARYGDSGGDAPGVAPPMAPLDPDQTENLMADVLTALRLKQCCRTRMVCAVDFRRYY